MALGWGILGTGKIARRFAQGIAASKTGRLVAVASRTQESANQFAAEYPARPLEGYAQILDAADVNAVYISLPHHLHAEWTILCAKAGKHILCEKPFTLNAIDAEQALAEVKAADVFFMEAFMYRCHPQTLRLKELLAAGAIGIPLLINAEFGFKLNREGKNFRAVRELGGGGLMDVGTYCVSMSRLIAAEEPERFEYSATFSEEGYDALGGGLLAFGSGLRSVFACGIHSQFENAVRIYGSEGRIDIPSPWFCDKPIRITDQAGKETLIAEGLANDLYSYEVDAVSECLSARQAPMMDWEDTLNNARALDALRRSAGLRFTDDDPAFANPAL